MTKETAEIRDQLGKNPDVLPLLNADYYEYVTLEEGPALAKEKTLGNAWIVGSSTNGIVGTNTGTEGGGQQVVGGSGRVTTVVRVVSANNKFHEFFTTTQLIDTTNTTATQIIADGKVIF